MSDAPKSAYELAMERLRRKDAEQGIVERPLTDEQKAEIAEIRRVFEAKLAQEELLHRSSLPSMRDPAEIAAADESYRRERDRLISERDSKIEKVRNP
jgi:hypothetical protein